MPLITQFTRICVTGINPEAYVQQLISEHIIPKNVQKESGILYLTVKSSQAKEAVSVKDSPNLSRDKVSVEIIGQSPLPILRRKAGIAAGGVLAAALTLVMNSFIWSIKVEGNEKYTQAQISSVLEEYGIKPGSPPPDLEAIDSAEKHLEKNFDRIGSAIIQMNGSKLTVKIDETDGPRKIGRDIPCNLVAGRSGVILEINSVGGKPVIAKGSGVKEGDLLVSGFYVKNGRNVIEHTDGEVIARCTETKTFFCPYRKEIYSETGNTDTFKSLKILNFYLPLNGRSADPGNSRYSESSERIFIDFGFMKYELPFRLKTSVYSEIEKRETFLSYQDAQLELTQSAENYKSNFLENCEIIGEEKEVYSDENGMTWKVTWTFETNIAVQTGE